MTRRTEVMELTIPADNSGQMDRSTTTSPFAADVYNEFTQ